MFMLCDLIALLLQAAGGALASSSDMGTADRGLKIMMAGLSAHVISLALFICLCTNFAWRVKMHGGELEEKYNALRGTRLFQFCLFGTLVIHGDKG